MKTCEVKLAVSRTGPAGAQNRGAIIEVGLLEAGRMYAAGQCERPEGKTLKAIAVATEKAGVEIASAPVGASQKVGG